MKKFIVLTSLLGAAIAAQSASAASSYLYYVENAPVKSSYTITLSGECSGKITKPVSSVSYGRGYDYTGGVVDRGGSHGEVTINTPDDFIQANGVADGSFPGDKLSETVKKGKLSLNLLVKSRYATSIFRTLADGTYDAQITCKDSQTLSQHLLGDYPSINTDAPSFKAMASLSHTNLISSPDTGVYKAKVSVSGEITLQGQCAAKGTLFSADYSLVCGPAKTIKVKIVASAEGTSLKS